MSEDFQIEDEAEKLAETPSEVVSEYLNEHGGISKEKLISLLIEKCDLSRDEAEKIFGDFLEKKKLRYVKAKGGYVWANLPKIRFPKLKSFRPKSPPRRKAKAPLHTVLHLPQDPHTLPNKSHFLAKDWHPYYHPAMDKDKLGYLKAKEKMGEGADWPS